MSKSYYCDICNQEVLEIKSYDSIICDIGYILILCDKCEKKEMLYKKQIKCTWIKEEDMNGEYYETSCNGAFVFIEGDHKENNYNFCPKCGKEINETKII